MTAAMTFCGIDVRDDFRAVASVAISAHGVASVRVARASKTDKVDALLSGLSAPAERTRYASVLHANVYDTAIVKIPATVRRDDEIPLIEQKLRDVPRPSAPRRLIVKRTTPTQLSVHYASEAAIEECESHAAGAIGIDAASAWRELAPDAVIDVGDDGSAAAIYIQSRSSVPFVKPLSVMPAKDLAELVVTHLGNARSDYDAKSQSILFSGRDMSLFRALQPYCKRLGFALDLVRLGSHVNPPWALAVASAVAAARISE